MIYKPWKYQQFAERHIIRNNNCGLFLDMGLGKTPITLTAIYKLKYWYASATKVLIIAPALVAENTWHKEIQKWDHLQRLSYSLVIGDQRHRIKALSATADIYVISCDNVPWLVSNYRHRWPFDMVVFDESSKFKNHAAKRFKAISMVKDYIYRSVILTGTPVPNGLIDLWAQIFLLDEGERLGKNITAYRDNLFLASTIRGSGHVTKYTPKERAEKTIHSAISDICISFQAEDYKHLFKLPKRKNNIVEVELTAPQLKAYKKFEREKVLELFEGNEITAINAAVLAGKLQQYANGFVYDTDKQGHAIHDIKIRVLEELVEAANGQSILLFYWFKHDKERVWKRFKHLRLTDLSKPDQVVGWNKGQYDMAVVHPGSAGMGLNLQDGGHNVVWFGPIWALELFMQGNARVDRQGQKNTVVVTQIVIKGTIDEMIMERQAGKYKTLLGLIKAVKANVDKGA